MPEKDHAVFAEAPFVVTTTKQTNDKSNDIDDRAAAILLTDCEVCADDVRSFAWNLSEKLRKLKLKL